jgi:hypothetical protein
MDFKAELETLNNLLEEIEIKYTDVMISESWKPARSLVAEMSQMAEQGTLHECGVECSLARTRSRTNERTVIGGYVAEKQNRIKRLSSNSSASSLLSSDDLFQQ